MGEGLSTLYHDLLSGSYDCVDRIVLNAYFRMGHDPGGFRLRGGGSDATPDNAQVAEAYLSRTPTMYRIIAVGRTCSVP